LGIKEYLYLPAQDIDHYDISQFFKTSYTFIEEARRHTNVLVHCIAGVSRSATIVAAYLIKKESMTAENAIKLLQSRRTKVKVVRYRFLLTKASGIS
jgi:dual specificity phosphatase 12